MVKVQYAAPAADGADLITAPTVLLDLDAVDLTRVPSETTVLRTGFGAPFPLLPDRVIELLLSVETEILSRAGLNAGGLLVDEWWDDRLVEICDRLQIPALVSPRVVRSGTLSRFHHTRPAFGARKMDPGMATAHPTVPPSGPAVVEVVTMAVDPDDHDLTLLMRTFTRLMSRLPERPGAATLMALPAAVDGSAFLPASPSRTRLQQRRAMLALRTAMAEDRRRGETWGRLRRVDWDGDGVEEVEMETARFLAMYDPESASLPTVADKRAKWPISSTHGEPGWIMVQHLADPAGDLSPPLTYSITGLEEAKDRLVLTAEATDGSIVTRLTVEGQVVSIDLDVKSHPPGLLGPELSLLLERPRMRVDGSDWSELSGPSAATGHKFRFEDDGHGVLVTSVTPVTMFLRVVDDGLIVWAHWTTDGTSRHLLTMEFSGYERTAARAE